MKRRIYIFLMLILSVTAFVSCEKVIDIDLNNAEPKIVIEANLNDLLERQYVKISKTTSFSNTSEFIGVTGALITLTDENGIVSPFFSQESPGVYFRTLRGIPTKEYTLKVRIGTTTYIAVSKMPRKVTLDSVSVTELTFLGDSRKFLQLHYKDPADVENQYNYIIDVNSTRINSYYVESDRFNNGKIISNTVFTDEPEIVSGDNVKLDFQGIDMNIYKYFFAITQIAGNGGPPVSPSNPDSNFDNGALGYFSAHTSDRRVFKVK